MADFWKKSGTTPLHQEYNATVDKLHAIEKELREAERQVVRPKARYKLTNAYSETDKRAVRFTLVLQNKEAFDSIARTWGGLINTPEETIHTVGYIWVNGVLLHMTGGTMVFDSFDKPTLISQEDWESLCALKVPESLKNRSHMTLE